MPGSASNLRNAPLSKRIHELTDNFVFERVLLPRALHLQHQTFPQIPRAHTRWMKALNQGEHILEIFFRDPGVERHLFRSGLQKTVIVDVADDQFRGLAIVSVQKVLIELSHQMLLERLLGRD